MMIDVTAEKEDGEEKEYLTTLIVNQMKKSYITWNRGQVPDEVIIGDLLQLSRGRLKITPGVRILEAKELVPPVKKKPMINKQHGKQQNKQFGKKKGYSRH